jgi:Subtilase family
MNKKRLLMILLGLFCSVSYAETIKFPKIDKHPIPADYSSSCKLPPDFPKYDPEEPFSLDFRSCLDIKYNLKDKLDDLLLSDFDSKTKWPESLPKKFNPDKIMETGKNPGLKIRKLHKKGITGKGIGIAVIDQRLLVDHVEYKDRLRLYEEIHWPNNTYSSMHGPAVASIAVGKTVGVAPKADLYYIAEWHADTVDGKFNASYIADSIDRILDINKTLPKDRKIRVISISKGFDKSDQGAERLLQSIEKAKKANIFVITTSLGGYNFAIAGLDRDPLGNPDNYSSYKTGLWWTDDFFERETARTWWNEVLKFPMDRRTTASPTGINDYVYYTSGGLSWVVPWVAGLYALACQVKPDITPELFFKVAFETASSTKVKRDGKKYDLKNIVNPTKLIKELQKQ